MYSNQTDTKDIRLAETDSLINYINFESQPYNLQQSILYNMQEGISSGGPGEKQ